MGENEGGHIQWNIQLSSVAQSCRTLCDPMNCSTPSLPIYHQLPEFTHTQVHWVSDATQPYYSAIKRNKFESVQMRQMNLEPVIQSEISQKEKNKYHINAYIWNLEKWYWWACLQGTNRDADVEDGLCPQQGKERWDELKGALINIYTTMCKTASGKLLYNTGSPAQCSVMT